MEKIIKTSDNFSISSTLKEWKIYKSEKEKEYPKVIKILPNGCEIIEGSNFT